MEKVYSFMLFGHSIKMEKEQTSVVDGVSCEKNTTYFFELIKIDNDTRLLFKKDDCARKMIDFMGLSKEHIEKNINGLIGLKDVQERPKYDETSLIDGPVLRIGSSASKKRSWISTCDDHVPCWPTLHKKQRTVRGPNTTTSTSAVVRLPLVNAKENHKVNAVFPNPHQQVLMLGDQDSWKIKKILKKSDVNGSSRLLIGTDMVSRHILPHVLRNINADFDVTRGTQVVVWDMDTGSQHKLTLKRWKSKSFVFVGGWMSDFVKRRNLKENDEIALKWDDTNSMLEFTLLHRKH